MSTNANTTSNTAGAKTDSALSDIKSGLKGIHGLGESIRGTFNSAVDSAFNEPTGEAHNRAIANKGEQEIHGAEQTLNKHTGHTGTGTGAGAGAGAGQTTVTTGGVSAGGVPGSGTGAAGSHATPVGNLGEDGTRSGTTQEGWNGV